ncbi:MAG: M23 family metallopeptidase [Sphingomonadales bacterium]
MTFKSLAPFIFKWLSFCASVGLLMLLPNHSQGLELHGALKQGGLVMGQDHPGTQVFLDGELLKVDSLGRFVFGFARDAGPEANLKIVYSDGKTLEQTLKIAEQEYQIERIDGLPPKTVTIPEEEKIRRAKETAMVREARKGVSAATDWVAGFMLPAEGRISGVYGSQRILNGEPRWPHFGLDIAAPLLTPVKAPASGVVTLAEKEFLLEGGIIIIDHGFGLTSTLMHLAEINVSVGQRVKMGEGIAGLGDTGRASGPHVDWRINWRSVRLDPALALEAGSLVKK